jgi:DNA primase
MHKVLKEIENKLKLRKAGKNYIGLCPFHDETTPSFTISLDKGIWHCFGCHRSGYITELLKEMGDKNDH